MIKYDENLKLNELFTIFASLKWLMSKFYFFNEYSGFLSVFTLVIGILICLNHISIRKNDIRLFITIILWSAFVIATPNILFSSYFNISLIVLLSCFLFYGISNNQVMNKYNCIDKASKKLGIADLVFYLMFVDYFGQIVLYTITQSSSAFKYESQYVAFSVEVLMIYMFGIKRGHIIPSCILVCLTIMFIPSRTFLSFIIIHILCYCFNNKIKRILKQKIFKTTFRIILFLNIVFFIIGYIFVYVFPQMLTMTTGHGSIMELFDASNYSRFRSNIYAVYALLKKIPLFHGIAEFDSYLRIGNIGFFNMHHPHNSYLQLMVFYSIGFGVAVIYIISKIFDRYMHGINISFIIPYIVIANILHDLFTTNIFIFFVILNMEQHEFYYVKIRLILNSNKYIKKKCERINA